MLWIFVCSLLPKAPLWKHRHSNRWSREARGRRASMLVLVINCWGYCLHTVVVNIYVVQTGYRISVIYSVYLCLVCNLVTLEHSETEPSASCIEPGTPPAKKWSLSAMFKEYDEEMPIVFPEQLVKAELDAYLSTPKLDPEEDCCSGRPKLLDTQSWASSGRMWH